jgi:apolipoprotein N-acyltransferase
MKRIYAYWIFTGLAVLWLAPSGVVDAMRIPAVLAILARLGYPAYLSVILGIGKLLAVAALLDPRTRFLREWAYAGLTFDLLGAFVSHLVVHDPVLTALTPLLVLAFVAGSYLLRPDKLKLRATA